MDSKFNFKTFSEHLQKEGLDSFIDLNDLKEKSLYLWRYDTKSIVSFKHSPLHFYNHAHLRPNKALLQMVFKLKFIFRWIHITFLIISLEQDLPVL